MDQLYFKMATQLHLKGAAAPKWCIRNGFLLVVRVQAGVLSEGVKYHFSAIPSLIGRDCTYEGVNLTTR